MPDYESSEDELIERATAGDDSAVTVLFEQHRDRLLHMVAVRIDPRVVSRIDPSDVVQESLCEAHERLPDYAATRPLPLYPWLRQIAWERLMRAHERHLHAKRRSVSREQTNQLTLSNDSAFGLVELLAADGTSPSGGVMREELQTRIRDALSNLSLRDREVLVMRYLEHMSVSEISATLRISDNAVRMRQLRALQKLRGVLSEDDRVH